MADHSIEIPKSKYATNQQDIRLSYRKLDPSVIFEQNTRILMRDGVTLSANVFRPSAPGKYPVIIAVSPYGKDNFSQNDIFRQVPNMHLGKIDISDHVAFEAPDPDYWCTKGYVVIQGDTRGQGQSDGDAGPFHPTDRQDFYDLIEWAAVQPWSNGNIGLNGVSYLCISQWSVASLRPPHLKAIIPWEGWNDFFRRFYFGGIPETFFMNWLWNTWIMGNHNPKSGFVEPDYLENADKHRFLDEYWKGFDYEIEKIQVPALICASFSDQGLHTRDTFEGFKKISSEEKWLFNHRRPKWAAFYDDEALEWQRKFLDFHLKGEGRGLLDEKPVRIEVNENREQYKVVRGNNWPLETTHPMALFLDGAKSIASRSGQFDESSVAFNSDAGESVTFDYLVTKDFDLIGTSKLKLWVSSETADDLDLFVGIKKFDRDGEEILFCGFHGTNPNDIVARGWLRASHREINPEKSTPLQSVMLHRRKLPLTPRQPVPVEIEILPAGVTFRAGEKLRVQIQGSRITPDAAILGFNESVNKGKYYIHCGGRYDSHLLIPVVDL